MRATFLFAALLAPISLFAADKPQNFTEITPGGWDFSLLPRAFQKNPKVDVTVITEMTPDGRKRREPTEGRPATYLPYATGYHDEGQGVTGEHPLPVALLQERLEKALRQNHYVPVAADKKPELTIFFAWGSANRLDDEISVDQDSGLPVVDGPVDIGHKNLLSRAALVGGERFAHELEQVLSREDEAKAAGLLPGITPLEQLAMKSDKTARLIEQAQADCFYMVASAYDTAALAKGKRVLLWRTKMTANSQGISMADTLPSLATAGGPYFGKDMPEAATLSGHLVPVGQVEIGTPVPVPDKPPH